MYFWSKNYLNFVIFLKKFLKKSYFVKIKNAPGGGGQNPVTSNTTFFWYFLGNFFIIFLELHIF